MEINVCPKGYIKISIFAKDIALIVLGVIYAIQTIWTLIACCRNRNRVYPVYDANQRLLEEREQISMSNIGASLTSGSVPENTDWMNQWNGKLYT